MLLKTRFVGIVFALMLVAPIGGYSSAASGLDDKAGLTRIKMIQPSFPDRLGQSLVIKVCGCECRHSRATWACGRYRNYPNSHNACLNDAANAYSRCIRARKRRRRR